MTAQRFLNNPDQLWTLTHNCYELRKYNYRVGRRPRIHPLGRRANIPPRRTTNCRASLCLLFALTEVKATNLALITIKMLINPQIYIEQLTEQQDRHKNWLELKHQFKFKIFTTQKYDITPQQKYNSERKRVFVVAPRKLKYNPTAQQLYEEFSK